MDIEGGEFDVIPNMLVHGSICLIDLIAIEWHHRFIPNAEKDIEKMLVYMTSHAKRCKFKILNMDDETYNNDTDIIFPTEMRKLSLNVTFLYNYHS